MGGPLRRRYDAGQRVRTPRRRAARQSDPRSGAFALQPQGDLPAPEQLGIDLGQDLGIDQRPVLDAARVVDAVALAERVERRRGSGMPAPREREGVDHEFHADRRVAMGQQLGVDEPHVELGIVDDELGALHEGQELGGDEPEDAVLRQEARRQAVHREGILRHVPLRVDVAMEMRACAHGVDELDAGDLDQPVPLGGIEPGGLRIEDDLPHQPFAAPSLCECLTRARSAAT